MVKRVPIAASDPMDREAGTDDTLTGVPRPKLFVPPPAAHLDEVIIDSGRSAKADDDHQEMLDGERSKNSIEIFRSLDGLWRVRDFWVRNQKAPRVDFDEYCDAIRASSGKIAPFVFALERNGDVCALVIGRVELISPGFRLAYWEPISTPIKTLRIDHGGVMGDLSAQEAELIASQILAALRRGAASMVRVSYLAVTSSLYMALRKSPSLVCSDPVVEFNRHWRLELPETYQQFYASRSKNTQSNLRKYSNRVSKEFGDRIRIVRYGNVHELDSAIKAVESIASRTYHRRLGKGFADTPELRAAWTKEAARGWLCVHVLLVDDRPTAFWAGTIYKRTYILNFTGYDPDFAYYHLGQYLWLKTIEEFCATHEVKIYDFGYSDEAYKQSLGTAATDEACFYVFGPTSRGLSLKLLRLITSGTTVMTRSVLERTNLLPRLKSVMKKWLSG